MPYLSSRRGPRLNCVIPHSSLNTNKKYLKVTFYKAIPDCDQNKLAWQLKKKKHNTNDLVCNLFHVNKEETSINLLLTAFYFIFKYSATKKNKSVCKIICPTTIRQMIWTMH